MSSIVRETFHNNTSNRNCNTSATSAGHNRKAKQITLGTTNGKRLKGRRSRRWSDVISDWCRLSVRATVRLAAEWAT